MIAVRSGDMITILSALVSVLSFREHRPLGIHNDFKHIAFWFYNQNPRATIRSHVWGAMHSSAAPTSRET